MKRRVIGLARLDLDVVHLDTGPVLVRGRRVRDARLVMKRLELHGTLDHTTLVKGLDLEAWPVSLDAQTLATLSRDLRAMTDPALRALAGENRRHFARFGPLDDDWLEQKEERLVRLRGDVDRPPRTWTDSVVELIVTLRGEDESIAVRDALAKSRDPEKLALLALAFRIGRFGKARLPWLRDVKVEPIVLVLRGYDLTIAQACRIGILEAKYKKRIAKFVGGGLPLSFVEAAERADLLDKVAYVPDARSARAYITWALRLDAHYKKLGVAFALPTEIFERLPADVDLAVLTHCLLEPTPTTKDPIAALDATLGLFRHLPAEARHIIERLRAAPAGIGRRHDPAFAAWLGDDALLDRVVHLASLVGERPISRQVRADVERAARYARERAHLEALPTRTLSQQRRLESLLTRPATPISPARTIRRLHSRIERLLPIVYQRQLDETFRHILRKGWKLDVPTLTPAWRDAVRFWLVAEHNRELLEKLLREAAKRPGVSVKDAFGDNVKWIAKSGLDLDAWQAPRREGIPGTKLTIHCEDDPLEVLRMGIPFATCLALTDVNAAATVVNAIDANKRVIYVRNEANNIVARKLVAISKDACVVGYQLYSSLTGDDDDAVRAAMMGFCEKLAADVGAPLASTGTPVSLNDGWWYDDGEVPFDPETSVVVDYCRAIGLEPPAQVHESLNHEALGWRARQTGDAALAARMVLSFYAQSPTAHLLGDFAVQNLELRQAVKLAQENHVLGQALLRHHAKSEGGLLFAIELARRLPGYRTKDHLDKVLRSFSPSPKVAFALVDFARWWMRKSEIVGESGPAHMVLEQLPRYVDGVARSLDLLDAFDPVLDWIRDEGPRCYDCVKRGQTELLAAFARAYTRQPDPEAIVTALRSKRRSVLAHRAALCVAAMHVLPDGARALERIGVIDPKFLAMPAGIQAVARQAGEDVAPVAEPPGLVEKPCDWAVRVRAGADLEREVLALAASEQPEDVVTTDGVDQLEAAFAIVLAKAEPKAVAKIFHALDDALSIAMFRRALDRSPAARVAAIQAQIKVGVNPNIKRRRTFYAWIAGVSGIRAT